MSRSEYYRQPLRLTDISYIEKHGEGATMKPWVWIIWIASGPLLGTIFQQLYIFVSVRSTSPPTILATYCPAASPIREDRGHHNIAGVRPCASHTDEGTGSELKASGRANGRDAHQ